LKKRGCLIHLSDCRCSDDKRCLGYDGADMLLAVAEMVSTMLDARRFTPPSSRFRSAN
jgi:hypothetical protein